MNLFRPWLGVSSPSPPVFIEDEQEEEGEDNSEHNSRSSDSECDTTEDSNSACLETATPTTTVTTGSMFDFDTCESSHTPSNGMGDKVDSQSKLMAELASMALADKSQTGSGIGASCSSYSYYYNYYYSQLLYYATLYGTQQQQQQTGVSMPPPPPPPVSTTTTNAEMGKKVGETVKRCRSQEVNASSSVPLSSSSSPSSFVDTLRGIVEHRSSIKLCASVATTTTTPTSVVTSKASNKSVKSSLANLTSFRGGASVFPTTLTAPPPTPGVAPLPVERPTTATAVSNNALKKISSMMDIQSLLTFQNMFFDNFGNTFNGSGKKRLATSRTANGSSSSACVERPKKFVCVECKSAFSNRSQLNSHIRTHTGERPFVCDYKSCHKSFTRNEELTRHRRIHSGVRPYPCRWCDKRFGRKDHLRKHERTHERRLRSTIFLNYSTGLPGLFPLATTTSSASSTPAELVNTLLPVVASGGSRTSNGTSAKHSQSHKLH